MPGGKLLSTPGRAPKMPKVSAAFGLSGGQKKTNKAIAATKADNARVAKIHAAGAKASARARGRQKHRPSGSPKGGQFM